jgi:prepilin-type N-terminal cleavage/methylation domain-containing protein
MRSRPEGEAGFTLLEVLVAFVILTLVVTACLQVYSRSAAS